MKSFLTLALIVTSFSQAFAGEEVIQKLIQETEKGSVFKQTTKNESCPKYLVVEQSSDLPENAKSGDLEFYLNSSVPGRSDSGSFTHENNSISYRPGLKSGKTHTLNKDLAFVLGGAYTKSTQLVSNGVLTSAYTAKIASMVMIGTSNSEIRYDSKKNTINYFFSGNGVDDVNCSFSKIK